jgi:predicted GNAT family acetyltransferase
MPLSIRHDIAAQRFEVEVDGERCELDYRVSGGVMTITHTGVPSAVGGRGIAGELVAAAFAAAAASGWKVNPACSYAAGWAQRHPEVAQLLA